MNIDSQSMSDALQVMNDFYDRLSPDKQRLLGLLGLIHSPFFDDLLSFEKGKKK